MNSEADFLAAIAASPDDTLLLGAFADWLEEQGDRRAPWVRKPVVRAWMGPTFADPIEPILQSLRQQKKVMECRRAAAEIGEAIVPGLIELLKHEDEYVRLQGAFCLRRVGKRALEAVPALMAAMKDAHYEVREQAAKALKAIGLKKGADTDTLREALTDHNYMVRKQAAGLLASLGAKGEVLEQLAAQCGDAAVQVRLDAVVALGNLQNKDAVGPLCRALEDDDEEVRQVACGYLSNLVTRDMTEAVEPLVAALKDESELVQRLACQALARQGKVAEAAIPDLLLLVKSKSADLREEAARALGRVGAGNNKVLKALYRATTDRVAQVAFAAAVAMDEWGPLPAEAGDILLILVERIGDTYRSAPVLEVFGNLEEVTPQVLACLRLAVRGVSDEPGNDWYRCTCAANALWQLGPRAAAAIPELVHAARLGHEQAARALGRMGEAGIAQLIELFSDESEQVRINAVNGLRQLSEGTAVAVPHLREILRETSGTYLHWRRRVAIDTLRSIRLTPSEREAATAAIPDLLHLMQSQGGHSDDDSATFTLGVFGPDLLPHFDAIAKLATTHEDYWVRARAASLLAKLVTHTTAVLPPLRQALRDACIATKKNDVSRRNASLRIRRHAVEAMGKLGDAAAPAVAEVIPLLNDAEEDIRREAAVTLGQMRSLTAVPGLRSALRDSAEGVRARAAEALGDLADPAATADLIRALQSDASARVRRETADALGRIRSTDEAIAAALRAAENDDDKNVRARASAALKKVERRKNPR